MLTQTSRPNVDDALLAYVLLMRYLQSEDRPAAVAELRSVAGPCGQLGGVTATCFLLYRPPAGQEDVSVHRFLFQYAPVLLQQLSRTTQRERVVMASHTRGRVDWSGTYKARYGAGANPSIFVCLQSSRLFDRPENQLLKFVLHQLQVCLERVPFYLQEWQAWGAALQENNENEPLRIGRYLSTLAHRVRMLSSHISLRDVELPQSIESRHVLAARTSKNELYTGVSNLYQLHRQVVNFPDWEQWVRVVSQTLPLPAGVRAVRRLLDL